MQKIETAPKKLSLAKQRIAELSNVEFSFTSTGNITEKCTTNTDDTSRGLEAMVMDL
jgi:hypothetical protein